jgi:hypothetical protein
VRFRARDQAIDQFGEEFGIAGAVLLDGEAHVAETIAEGRVVDGDDFMPCAGSWRNCCDWDLNLLLVPKDRTAEQE